MRRPSLVLQSNLSLSKIKMPKLFDFRAQLPREANGKLYKRELRDEYQQQAEQQTEQA